MEFKKEELIKSPLNYTGGKFKLLPQILPLFPNDIDTFVDLFAGGCNVGVNVKANKVICNDLETHVIELLSYWKNENINIIINNIFDIIHRYKLSESSMNGYEYYGCNSNDGLSKFNNTNWRLLRENYNKTKDIKLLYPLIIYTFNNNIKFNEKNEFIAGGCNKRDFNKSLQNNFNKFINELHNKNVIFFNKDFNTLKINNLNKYDLVYCDPPYLITEATYNKIWNIEKEKELLDLLDKLNDNHIRFVLSNVLESKGKSNDILKEWSKKYIIHNLNNTYGNCNYHTKDKSADSTQEVLITNY